MICPVVTYAPTAATKPNIAAQPLKRSASGVMIKKWKFIWIIVTGIMKVCKVIFSFFAKINYKEKKYAWLLQYCYKYELKNLCLLRIEKWNLRKFITS